MYCNKCGKKIVQGTNICPNCGNVVGNNNSNNVQPNINQNINLNGINIENGNVNNAQSNINSNKATINNSNMNKSNNVKSTSNVKMFFIGIIIGLLLVVIMFLIYFDTNQARKILF